MPNKVSGKVQQPEIDPAGPLIFGWLRPVRTAIARSADLVPAELLAVALMVPIVVLLLVNVVHYASGTQVIAKMSELRNLQDAFEIMMADRGLTTVDAHDLSTASIATNDFTKLPTGAGAEETLTSYLHPDKIAFYYGWNSLGRITEQVTAATACTK